MTGPEKVVFAIIVSCIAVKLCSLYTVCLASLQNY